MIPASLATSSGSPFGFCGTAFNTAGDYATNALAFAVRFVVAFRETSTIEARPALS
jgi:hypothetical protein